MRLHKEILQSPIGLSHWVLNYHSAAKTVTLTVGDNRNVSSMYRLKKVNRFL